MYNLQSAGKLVIKMYQLWNWGLFDKSTIVAWTTISEENNLPDPSKVSHNSFRATIDYLVNFLAQ